MWILQRAFSAFLLSSVTVQESAFMWYVGCLLGWKDPLKIPRFTSDLKKLHKGDCMWAMWRSPAETMSSALCCLWTLVWALWTVSVHWECFSGRQSGFAWLQGDRSVLDFYELVCCLHAYLLLARNAKRDFSIVLGIWWTTLALQLDGRKPVWFGLQNTELQHWSLWICYLGEDRNLKSLKCSCKRKP